MFEKKLMISGLRKQSNLLSELIGDLEEKSGLEYGDCSFYDERTKLVARNLRKLRKIKNDYFNYAGFGVSMQ